MLPLSAYRITPAGSLPLSTQATSLDELTRQLPPGFYTTFRTFDDRQRVLGLKVHLRRLYQPAAAKSIQPAVSDSDLRAQLATILRGNSGEIRVRLIMTTQGAIYCLLSTLVSPPPEIYEKGVKVTTVDIQRESPRVKSTGFITVSQDAREQIARDAIFEALLMQNGRILEGMTSNFFYVKDDVLGTARDKILLGVTRRTVLHIARRSGVGVVCSPLKWEQISALSEAFITSSSRGIVPIVQINDMPVGEGIPGIVTKKLADAYLEYVTHHAEIISFSTEEE